MDEDLDVPLRRKVIALVYNLKKNIASAAVDAEAELDSIETVQALTRVFESKGLSVLPLEADTHFSERIAAAAVDLVFNIAEGIHGRGREAQIPAILDMLDIPYVGSDATALGLSLDKAMTKRMVASYHIKTPHAVLACPNEPLHLGGLSFPLIVKPNAEGSGKGIGENSVVRDRKQLEALLAHSFALYHEPMLIESYIAGREFTVGVLGNGENLRVFEPMEIEFLKPTQDSYTVYSYKVKQEYQHFVRYHCPAEISATVRETLLRDAKRVFRCLGCQDFARVDFRVAEDGTVYFIEINPLPGLAPQYSDYPMLAAFCGVSYDALIYEILLAGAKRLGLSL